MDKKILVSGSIAYDTIMEFGDEFCDLILPDQINNLNVCFNISKLEKNNGGTWHNIAYSLWLLWAKNQTILLAWVGRDFEESKHLSKLIDYSYLNKDKKLYTANCTVVTEAKWNQIITFYPWASDASIKTSIHNLHPENISYAICAPNGKVALKFLEECSHLGIFSFFDPGQTLWLYSPEELRRALDLANGLIVNEYEYELIMSKTGWDEVSILQRVDKLIVTLWANGVRVVDLNNEFILPAVSVDTIVDPTGCGDGFRAGLLYGLNNNKPWKESAKIWLAVASFVIQSQWGMNHTFTLEDVLKLV